MTSLANKQILLGVTGGIAAYKSADLVRRLQDAGASVQVVMTEAAAQFNKLGGVDVYAERWVPYAKELAVIVVRCKDGLRTYPIVETVQRDSICHAVIAPARRPVDVLKMCRPIKNAQSAVPAPSKACGMTISR